MLVLQCLADRTALDVELSHDLFLLVGRVLLGEFAYDLAINAI